MTRPGPAKVLGLYLALVLVLTVAGCGPGWAVTLLTADGSAVGCFTSGITGDLVVDDSYGTAIVEVIRMNNGSQRSARPVMWPRGYTGQLSGSRVEVLDKSGHVVAQTGTRVHMLGGYGGDNPPSWVACDLVLVDGRNVSVEVVS